MFGTLVAETILASARMRTHQQAGHMDASDPIKKFAKLSCREGAVHIWGKTPGKSPSPPLWGEGFGMRGARVGATGDSSLVESANLL